MDKLIWKSFSTVLKRSRIISESVKIQCGISPYNGLHDFYTMLLMLYKRLFFRNFVSCLARITLPQQHWYHCSKVPPLKVFLGFFQISTTFIGEIIAGKGIFSTLAHLAHWWMFNCGHYIMSAIIRWSDWFFRQLFFYNNRLSWPLRLAVPIKIKHWLKNEQIEMN